MQCICKHTYWYFFTLDCYYKVGCLLTVYFHFDHPSKGFVLVCRPYGLKHLLCQPEGTRCSIVHVIYQTKELIGILCKIFHSAADMSCVSILQQWTVDSFYGTDYSSTRHHECVSIKKVKQKCSVTGFCSFISRHTVAP